VLGCEQGSQEGYELLVRDVWEWIVIDHRRAIRAALRDNADMSFRSTKYGHGKRKHMVPPHGPRQVWVRQSESE